MPREWEDDINKIRSDKDIGPYKNASDMNNGNIRPDKNASDMNNGSIGQDKIFSDRITGDEIERLKEMIRNNQKKQLFYTRILTVVLGAILASFIIALCIILPPAVRAINHIDDAVTEAADTLEKADKAIDGVNSMTGQVTDFIETNSESVSESMKKLQDVDFDGLNKAISDLESVVSPMAKLFGR